MEPSLPPSHLAPGPRCTVTWLPLSVCAHTHSPSQLSLKGQRNPALPFFPVFFLGETPSCMSRASSPAVLSDWRDGVYPAR